MPQDLAPWFRSYRPALMLGLVVWVLLAAAGAIHARLAGLSTLQVIVTYDEWCAALLFLPLLATLGTRLGRNKAGRPLLVSQGYVLALVVFGLDLLVRALFGLGWEPFLLG